MEDLQQKHRQEQKDLQSRITQKKKSATKKTRKGINDECAELERQLKEKQAVELFALTDDSGGDAVVDEVLKSDKLPTKAPEKTDAITDSLSSLSVSTAIPTSNGQTKKPNRQKARLARRAAEQEAAVEQAESEAADLPNLSDQERQSMREAYTSRSLKEQEIRSDGHCLYAAIADQLQDSQIGLRPKIEPPITEPDFNEELMTQAYKLIRHIAAAYISQHPDDFVPFLEEPLDVYVKTIKETGEWGGHLEILALAKAYGVDVNVLRGDGSVQKIECGLHDDHPELWLAYYHHSFGLGEHYNSLRKAY